MSNRKNITAILLKFYADCWICIHLCAHMHTHPGISQQMLVLLAPDLHKLGFPKEKQIEVSS